MLAGQAIRVYRRLLPSCRVCIRYTRYEMKVLKKGLAQDISSGTELCGCKQMHPPIERSKFSFTKLYNTTLMYKVFPSAEVRIGFFDTFLSKSSLFVGVIPLRARHLSQSFVISLPVHQFAWGRLNPSRSL